MEKILIIYWSGTGNTKMMANGIAKGIRSTDREAEIFAVSDFNADIKSYSKIAFGCSAMGDEVLEEFEFEPFFESIEKDLSGKKVALFGSYGWGDGKWMRDWQDRVEIKGAKLYDEGLIINDTPDSSDIQRCHEFGVNFSKF